jgi:hypothetical protein
VYYSIISRGVLVSLKKAAEACLSRLFLLLRGGEDMTIRTYTKSILLIALVTFSLGGFLLHVRIHPVSQNPSNVVPWTSGVLSILVIPLLFSFKKTVEYGYVVNGFLVIVGTIGMAHFSIVNWPNPATLGSIIFKTLLADIVLLWSKFFIGKVLFDLEFFGYDPTRAKKGKTYRYPNLGWWIIHLAAISLVYLLGNLVWRQP